MESYAVYLKAKKAVAAAAAWLANKTLTDSQDRKPYRLHSVKFSADYCGQSCAGAKNYHSSPTEFNEAMQKVIRADFEILSMRALDMLKTEATNALIACEKDVDRVRKEIKEAIGESGRA